MKKIITLSLAFSIFLTKGSFAQLKPAGSTNADQLLATNSTKIPARHFSAYTSSAVFYRTTSEKAFAKGNTVIDAGVAFALYKTKIHQESSGYKKDTTDAAGGALYTIRGEYGVTDWLGVGARFGFTSFIDDKDSATGRTAKTTGIDLCATANLHFVKTRRFDMPLCISIGYGNFKSLSNDDYNTKVKGGGFAFGMGLMPRIYFGDHFGMNFLLGFMSYNFGNLKYSNKDDSNLNKTWDVKTSLKASGANIGIGLQYKL
ncbi:MAG: hypothetical protein ACJ76F_07190 [Bacteroidia bacterium]